MNVRMVEELFAASARQRPHDDFHPPLLWDTLPMKERRKSDSLFLPSITCS